MYLCFYVKSKNKKEINKLKFNNLKLKKGN